MRALPIRDEASGPPVRTPEATEFDSLEIAANRLATAIAAADLDEVDRGGRAGSAAPRPREQLRARSRTTIFAAPRRGRARADLPLAPAARRVPQRDHRAELLRGLARELARDPEWRLHWIDERPAADPATPVAVFDALAAVRRRTMTVRHRSSSR